MAFFHDVALAIFDMDGLLLDTERLGISVALETARRVGFPLTEEDVLATVGMTWEATHRYYRARYPQADGLEAFVDANKKAYEQALIDGEIPLKPGSLALVDRLLGRGVRCVVATSNSWERAHLCLKKTGLYDRFERVFCGEDVPAGKPDPAIFLLACQACGVSTSQTVVLEDSVNGLLAAVAGGMRCILVPDVVRPSAEQARLATVCLHSLEELLVEWKS